MRRHLSDRPKIGDIKKTVAAFSLAAWCAYSVNLPKDKLLDLPSLNTLKQCKTKTNPKFGETLFLQISEFNFRFSSI